MDWEAPTSFDELDFPTSDADSSTSVTLESRRSRGARAAGGRGLIQVSWSLLTVAILSFEATLEKSSGGSAVFLPGRSCRGSCGGGSRVAAGIATAHHPQSVWMDLRRE